ncbi:MAG TPA: TonB-dependent receptor [bacterium]|nr:TonB-dependent receptor [bacterium]
MQRWLILYASIFSFLLGTPARAQDDLTELDLSQLAELEITSVSKRVEALSAAPAAIFVVTREDIHRSGVTTLPEALRLAPGVQVARITTNQWAISIRGFASRLSRSVLVLIDGRSVYTPLFAGVYWEAQDLLLDDIERIEVIRGPGGTLWGANAVNGVINIITRSAQQTHGAYATALLGDEERGSGGLRYGGMAGNSLHYRAYAKYFDRDPGFHPQTRDYDAWSGGQGGFRMDWGTSEPSSFTLSGDLYQSKPGQRVTYSVYEPPANQTVEGRAEISGGNVLANVQRQLGNSLLQVRSYYDHTSRDEVNFEEDRNTFDFDSQIHFPAGERHEFVMGADLRVSRSKTGGIETVIFEPDPKTDLLVSGFVQDEVKISPDKLSLLVGSKFEHNDYTGFEAQPNLRLLYLPKPGVTLWSGISRAVRTPSMLEDNLSLTVLLDSTSATFARIVPNPDFESERVIAYEAGTRAQLHSRFWIDVAGFYNDYDQLYTIESKLPFTEAGARTILPYDIENRAKGEGYGGELAAAFQAFDDWRLSTTYSVLVLNLDRESGSTDTSQEAFETASPQHMATLHSSLRFVQHVHLDALLRYAGELESQRTSEYTELDCRLAWEPVSGLEFFAVGMNLLHDHHLEFNGNDVARVEMQRSFHGGVAYRW